MAYNVAQLLRARAYLPTGSRLPVPPSLSICWVQNSLLCDSPL
jgi:hypothetical protein